jgi:hypothetical protein
VVSVVKSVVVPLMLVGCHMREVAASNPGLDFYISCEPIYVPLLLYIYYMAKPYACRHCLVSFRTGDERNPTFHGEVTFRNVKLCRNIKINWVKLFVYLVDNEKGKLLLNVNQVHFDEDMF